MLKTNKITSVEWISSPIICTKNNYRVANGWKITLDSNEVIYLTDGWFHKLYMCYSELSGYGKQKMPEILGRLKERTEQQNARLIEYWQNLFLDYFKNIEFNVDLMMQIE